MRKQDDGSDEATYSPKLKRAAEEIKVILKKYDIGALVVLHTPNQDGVEGGPGFGEYVLAVTPSYSAIEWNALRDGVVIKGHRKHYGGDTKARDKALRDTINMLSILGTMGGMRSMSILDLCRSAEEVWETEHTEGTDTAHQAPLN